MRRWLLTLTVLWLGFSAGNAHAATAEEARQFVDNVGKRVIEVMNSSAGESQKQSQLRQMFSENVDIAWMARFVLGRGWQQASEEQKNRYQEAYKQYLLVRYTTNFSDYTGSKYTITDAKSEDEGQFIVNMQIKTPGKNEQDTAAGYRVHASGNGFKITDIIIEGVSLITTERSEFASVLQQKGVDGLISAIEAKTAAKK